MNWYKKYNEEKRELLKQADVILENKDYDPNETGKIYNLLATHIFSQSKKNMSDERNKYIDFLEDFKKEM